MSEALPLFSVVIPVYNRADKLPSALKSVLDQTVQNFEVIVVDDGSSDDPETVVRDLHDSRVRYVRQDNQGANVARNLGISLSRGKWVALLDSDDRFLPHHLETAHRQLNGTKSAYFARIIVDRGNGNTFLKPPRGPRAGEPLSEYLCCDAGFIQTSTLVLPADIAKSVHYLDWLPYGQDVDYALRLAAAGVSFIYDPEPGAIWDDLQTGKRVSSASRGAVRDRWADENRDLLTAKAYAGFRGWRSAKAYAEGGKTVTGLTLFAKAAIGGAYSPKQAARVGLQVLLAGGAYQKLVGMALKLKSAPSRRA